MAGTLADLAIRLNARATEIEQVASATAVNVALAVVKDLTEVTPVDTSKALSNWITTLDNPATTNIDPYSVGKAGSTQAASAAEALAQATQALQSKRPGQVIYITNNLPYIQRLNEGYSKQQPAGFVERALLIGRILVKNFKLRA